MPKQTSVTRTPRDSERRKETAHTLRTLHTIRHSLGNVRNAPARSVALLGSIHAKGKVQGKFVGTDADDALIERLGKEYEPDLAKENSLRKRTARAIGHLLTPKKRALLHTYFDGHPKLGIVVIRPELYHESRSVINRLKKLGCSTVLTKSIVFDKPLIAKIYPHVIEGQYVGRQVFFSRISTAPNRVLVFTLPTMESLIKKGLDFFALKQSNGAHTELDLLKEYLRGSMLTPVLRERGFIGASERPDRTGKLMDPYNFMHKYRDRLENNWGIFPGVHVPTRSELFRDAEALLSYGDLQRIERVMTRK